MSEPERAKEPMFNAPWTLVTLVVVILGGFAVQQRVADQVWLNWALVPADVVAYGRWETLLTSLFLHGGWMHALMNAGGALAFGAPVARLFGTRPGGAGLFFGFYLMCGVLAGLGFMMARPDAVIPVVGASGAVSGLMGAASRLIERRGRLGPLFARTPVGMAIAWTVVNLIFAFSFTAALTPGTGGAGIAWEAHLAGFFAGQLLIGPIARLAGRA